MRKLLIGVGAVVVLLVAAVLIGPSLIDWNKYKGEIEQQVTDLTGRKLTIAGDISIAILPAPAVVANDVTFANDPRSDVPNMVELGSLEVRVALGPLFGGEVQVSKVVLIEPVVQLEAYADGTNNWTLDLGSSSADDGSAEASTVDAASSEDGESALAGFTLDNFAIERGLVTFSDEASGALHVVEDINATLVASTLQGPFEARGDLIVKGIPLGFEVGVDGVFQGRTVPVSALITTGGETSVGVSGNIINLFDNPRFSGNLQVKSQSPATAANALGASLPPIADQSVALTSQIEGDQTAVSLKSLKLAFGEIEAEGGVEVSLGDIPRADVDLAVSHVDVDALLAGLAGTEKAATSSGTSTESTKKQTTESVPAAASEAFAIPLDIAASLNLTVESLAYRQEKAGPVRLSAELVNGEVTLSQLTAALPGSTDVAVFGFLTAANGAPNFEGEVEATIGDTRGLARWLDVDLSKMPGDRLRRVELSATLRGNAENLQAAGVRLAFDRTTLTGGVTLARRDRLSFGAALNLDTIDLDPYLAGFAAVTDTTSATAGGSSSDANGQNSGSATGTADTNPLAGLAALSGFDANIKAKAGEVIYQGTPIRDIAVDATVYQGALTLRDVSVKDIAGARVALAGKIDDLDGLPKLDGLSVDFAAKSVAGLAKIADIELPVPAKSIGAVSLKATARGGALGPSIKGQASAAGASVSFDGDVSVLPIKPLYAGTLRVAHPDTAALLRAFDVGYTPKGPIGGVDLAMNTSVTPETITLQGINGQINKTSVKGDTTVRLAGVRPDIRATLALGDFDADPFLPKEEGGASTSKASTGSGAANDNNPGYADGKAPWSRDPLDLSGMGAVDATINLTARSLAYGAIALSDAIIKAKLVNSQLTIEQLTGNAFGGALGITGFVDGQSTPAANGAIKFQNGNISKLLTSVIGQPAAIGTVALDTNFDTRGGSVYDMVAALNGKGGFNMRGVDVKGSTQGSAMTGILGLLRGFGQIGAGLSGQKLDGLADVTGQFTIANGVADLSPLNINSGIGSGIAGGKVDLAGWNVNLAGNVDITGNILTALLGTKIGTPGKLPFSVTGALDAPNIKMDTSGFNAGGGSAIPIPGVGNLLQGILGGGSSSQQQQQEPSSSGEPTPQPQQQQPSIQPQDLLKDIFKF